MITLKYVNNLNRHIVDKLDIPENLSKEEILVYLLNAYKSAGYEQATDAKKLYVVSTVNELVPLYSVENIEKDATIIYSAVVASNCAAEYARGNGVSYFFHTSEKGHREFPHIHARYADEEICVYFKDYRIVGTMSAKAKQREIIRYVKAHVVELQDEWNRIVQQ